MFSRIGFLVSWQVFSPVDGDLGKGTSYNWGDAIPLGYRPMFDAGATVTTVNGSDTGASFSLIFRKTGTITYNGSGCSDNTYLSGGGFYFTVDDLLD
jgi:hypothetical protein